MIAMDANVLSLVIYPQASVPRDFRTGQQIDHAKERIDGLISKLQDSGERIIIPTPALSEVLVLVAPDVQRHVEEIESQSCFKISEFGQRAAIELAIRTKRAKTAGDKKDGVVGQWDKIKYDRQIVAIAKIEGVNAIYSTDKDIHQHGKLWGIDVFNISDIPLPQKQEPLFKDEETNEQSAPVTPPTVIQGSSERSAEDQTASKTAQEGQKGQQTDA